MTMLTVTYSAAKAAGACPEGRRWAKNWIAAHEGTDTDTPIPLADVLDAWMEWAIWCLPIAQPKSDMLRIARLWACDCAERVLPLTGSDERCRTAIDVARRYAVGEATDEELDAAGAAAGAAARDAARAAEEKWQSDRLRIYLAGAELPPVEPITPKAAEAEVQS